MPCWEVQNTWQDLLTQLAKTACHMQSCSCKQALGADATKETVCSRQQIATCSILGTAVLQASQPPHNSLDSTLEGPIYWLRTPLPPALQIVKPQTQY